MGLKAVSHFLCGVCVARGLHALSDANATVFMTCVYAPTPVSAMVDVQPMTLWSPLFASNKSHPTILFLIFKKNYIYIKLFIFKYLPSNLILIYKNKNYEYKTKINK